MIHDDTKHVLSWIIKLPVNVSLRSQTKALANAKTDFKLKCRTDFFSAVIRLCVRIDNELQETENVIWDEEKFQKNKNEKKNKKQPKDRQ